MYQYASKGKAQSEGLKSSASTANKNHAQTGIKAPVQLMPQRPSSLLQMQLIPKQATSEAQPLPMMLSEEQARLAPRSAQSNNTGIPLQMKEKFENISGFSFDDVKVHYNSDKPAQLQALAYTQGNQVYIGPGQEMHLGHELGHVVQQKEGKVTPSFQTGNNVFVNNDPVLEREADSLWKNTGSIIQPRSQLEQLQPVCQTNLYQLKLSKTVLNVVGENHSESNSIRSQEKIYCAFEADSTDYWQEDEFQLNPIETKTDPKSPKADPFALRVWQDIAFIHQHITDLQNETNKEAYEKHQDGMRKSAESLVKNISDIIMGKDVYINNDKQEDPGTGWLQLESKICKWKSLLYKTITGEEKDSYISYISEALSAIETDFKAIGILSNDKINDWGAACLARSEAMHLAANELYMKKGVWKIGDRHREEIETIRSKSGETNYNLVSRDDFQHDLIQDEKRTAQWLSWEENPLLAEYYLKAT